MRTFINASPGVLILVMLFPLVSARAQTGTEYAVYMRSTGSVSGDVIRLRDVARVTGPKQSVCDRLGGLDLDDAPMAGNSRPVSRLQIVFRLRLAGIPQGAVDIHGERTIIRRQSLIVASAENSQPPGSGIRPASYAAMNSQPVGRGEEFKRGARPDDQTDRLRKALLAQLKELESRHAGASAQTSSRNVSAIPQSRFPASPAHSPTVRPVTMPVAGETVANQERGVLERPLNPEERVREIARNQVLNRLPWEPENVDIQITHVGLRESMKDLIRTGTLHAEVRSQWPPLGRVQLVVTAQDREKSVEIPVVMNVRHFQNIVISRRRIERGSPVTTDDVYLDRQEVRDLSSVHTSTNTVIGRITTRVVPPLQVIRPGDVRSGTVTGQTGQIVIKRGQAVRLVARGNSVSITVTAEAQQDGRVGDVIRVKNVDSKKIVSGRVTANGTVEAAL